MFIVIIFTNIIFIMTFAMPENLIILQPILQLVVCCFILFYFFIETPFFGFLSNSIYFGAIFSKLFTNVLVIIYISTNLNKQNDSIKAICFSVILIFLFFFLFFIFLFF